MLPTNNHLNLPPRHTNAAIPDPQANKNDGNTLDDAIGLENRGDYTGACQAYASLADAGDVVAKRNLGLILLKGLGVKEEKERGMLLLEEAAKENDIPALERLGELWTAGIYANDNGILKPEPSPAGESFADVKANFKKGSDTKVEAAHFLALRKVLEVISTKVNNLTGYEFEGRLENFDTQTNSSSGDLKKVFLWLPVEAGRAQAESLMNAINQKFTSGVVLKTEARSKRWCLVFNIERLGDPKNIKKPVQEPIAILEKEKRELEPHLRPAKIVEVKAPENTFKNYSKGKFKAIDRPGKIGKDVIFPYAKFENKVNISEENLPAFLGVANKVTINTPYRFEKAEKSGVNRPNHNGTHSARQLKVFEYAIKKIESAGNETAKKLLSTLTAEQILCAKMAVFLCRAGRVDESNGKSKIPDCYLERSAQLFELYARQTNLPPVVIESTSKMLVNAYDSKNKGFTEAQLMLINFMNASHSLDLYRCYESARMPTEEGFAKGNIAPYFNNGEAILATMITYAKAILKATGVDIRKHWGGYDSTLYKQCSNDTAHCFKQIERIK